jgi:hypothetical protein
MNSLEVDIGYIPRSPKHISAILTANKEDSK